MPKVRKRFFVLGRTVREATRIMRVDHADVEPTRYEIVVGLERLRGENDRVVLLVGPWYERFGDDELFAFPRLTFTNDIRKALSC